MLQSSFHTLATLPRLCQSGVQLLALKAAASERLTVLAQLHDWATADHQPLYFWSAASRRLQRVQLLDGVVTFLPVAESVDGLATSLAEGSGWFVLNGLLDIDDHGEISQQRSGLLVDTYYDLLTRPRLRILLLEDYIQLPLELLSLIPILEDTLPDMSEVGEIVRSLCGNHFQVAELDQPDVFLPLVRACLGLPRGELRLVLQQWLSLCSSFTLLTEVMLDHKISKLAGRGLEFIAKPDVPASGLDLLDAALERDAALLHPTASRYGLTFPRGLILWGPPGTGKSLSAKCAATKMGIPMIAANWGSLRSPKPGQSEKNLDFLLQMCGILSPVILYFDDFDKGFAGWNSTDGGGVESRLANKLLTWMQERQHPVSVIATVNRIESFPSELVRRFDDVFFVDLPHTGNRKAIFDVHLPRYFPAFAQASSPLTEAEWRHLLKATEGYSAAEIARIVYKTAREVFYWGRPGQCQLQDLLQQIELTTPASIRDEAQILAIRNRSGFARPASSGDTSAWATPAQQLFKSLGGGDR